MSGWSADVEPFDEASFNGQARLFPLPGLVLFPRVVQQLHIFEERYREMVRDALAGDGLIALSSFEPGWQSEYEGRPPLLPVACLGRIMAHHEFDDGRYNLMLVGLCRVRLVRELEPPLAFRRALVQVMQEVESLETAEGGIFGSGNLANLTKMLLREFERALPAGLAPDTLRELLTDKTPLSAITDLMAYTLPLPDEVKYQLLGETIVTTRAELLLEHLSKLNGLPGEGATGPGAPSRRQFPPPFSDN